MDRAASSYVPRVEQLDAVDLDKEVTGVLKDQLLNIFKFSGNSFLASWEPELELFLKIMIWKFSVMKNYATFGHQLLGLKFGGKFNSRKAWLLAFIMFGSKYLQSRSIEIANLTSSRSSKDMVHKTTRYVEVSVHVLNLVNFLIFLRKGLYPTLAYRLLGLTIVPIEPGKSRTIGYSYMTRELLWHGFAELLAFTLPLVNYHYLKRKIGSLIFTKEPVEAMDACLDHNTLCSLCEEPPILPYKIGCPHIFCYYCIKAQMIADSQFECNVCGFPSRGSIQLVKM
ncbi:peroxisome biogenesis factor 2 [Ischnura elegans]|uniref:peroxisome biogenesis factor 2 n=1 Tax=Ischnura elegans TaxID=197161 RepID=UPI001ED86A17|nr:peroxisome biogenesis factor 2 [Ischnura elegans]